MNKLPLRLAHFLTLFTGSLLLLACGGGGGGPTSSPTTYGVSAAVSGLSGTGLTLSVNNEAAIAVGASGGMVSLTSGLASGASYSVAVGAQPTHPVQTCTVARGQGTIESSNAVVQVSCSTAPAAAQTATQAVLGSDVSSTLSATIKQVATGFGTSSVGGWVPIALPDETSDLIVVAVDSAGSPVLAAMATSSSTTLNANSTALALARILMATTRGSATLAQINSAIEGSAGYASLVALIESDLSADVAPLGDSKVKSALLSVVISAQAALPAASTVAGAARSARAKAALGNPTMTEEGPFTVIPSADPNNPYFFITSLASAQTVTPHNAMALPWTAQTFPVNANSSVALAALGKVLVPAQTLLSGQPANLPMTNSPFNFVLTQDQGALNQIAKDFGQNLIESAVDMTLDLQDAESCVAKVANFLAKPIDISIINGGTFEATEEALLDALDPLDVSEILAECGLSNTVSGAILYTAIQDAFLETLTEALGEVSLASNVNQIFQEAWYANKEWNETYTVGVCAAQDYSINSCVASFQFYPAQLLMIPEASVSVTVTGLDASGKSTLLPGDLTVTASSPGTADVTGTAPFNVTASANGSIQVDVLDPATGATNVPPAVGANPFPVTVVTPTLSPSANTLTVTSTDQNFSVSLQGPNGQAVCTAALLEPCLSVPSGVTWSATSGTTTVNVVTNTGPTGTWTLPANAAPGTVNVTASAGGATYGPIAITVGAGVALSISPSTPILGIGTKATVQLTVSATDGSGGSIPPPPNLVWKSSADNVATVSSTGLVTGVTAGTATITVTDPASGAAATDVVTVSGWVGTWDGMVTSSCGFYSGPATADVTQTSPTQLDWDADTDIGEFDWSMTISGNTATGTLEGQAATLKLTGDTVSLSQPASCQTGTYTRQL